MHACGHDAHAAIAFGIAVALRHLDPPSGVRILFQPAEEAFPGGAGQFVDEGLVDGLKGIIDACGRSQDAFQLLMLEPLETLANASATAISTTWSRHASPGG